MSATQSKTCVSNSVHAGLVIHSMPWMPSPDESKSARIDGPDRLAGKKAKKFGDCQCVMPGRITRSKSASNAPNGSGSSGGCGGSCARIWPGSTCANTGYRSTVSW